MQLNLESTHRVEDQQQMLEDLRTLSAMRPAMKTGARRPPPPMKKGTKAVPRQAGLAVPARKTAIAVDKGKQPEICESHCHADKHSSFMCHVADTSKFSAPSTLTRHRSGPSGFDPNEDIEDVTTNSDSGVESIADWFDGEGLDELSQKQPAKAKETTKLEVCSQTCFDFHF